MELQRAAAFSLLFLFFYSYGAVFPDQTTELPEAKESHIVKAEGLCKNYSEPIKVAEGTVTSCVCCYFEFYAKETTEYSQNPRYNHCEQKYDGKYCKDTFSGLFGEITAENSGVEKLDEIVEDKREIIS